MSISLFYLLIKPSAKRIFFNYSSISSSISRSSLVWTSSGGVKET